jgi:prepilin-type N-terminal cleavage/methylation domain-containing protein
VRRRRDGQAGFTLPEVLIALALLAVIASLLVNAIASA